MKPEREQVLLDSARAILTTTSNEFKVAPWRTLMKNGAALAKSKEVKAAAKRIKARNPEDQAGDTFAALAQSQLGGGVDRSGSDVVESGSGDSSSNPSQGTTMEADTPTKTKQELDAEKAQAKIAEKERKQREKDAEKARKAEERKAAAEKKAAEKAAREAETGTKESTESMRALATRVKDGTYVKGKNGQLRASDHLALALESVAVEKMVAFLIKVLGLGSNPYEHLNYGQQSMNLRNRLRGVIRKSVEVDGAPMTLERVIAERDSGDWAFVPPAPKAKKEPEAPAGTDTPASEAQEAQPA